MRKVSKPSTQSWTGCCLFFPLESWPWLTPSLSRSCGKDFATRFATPGHSTNTVTFILYAFLSLEASWTLLLYVLTKHSRHFSATQNHQNFQSSDKYKRVLEKIKLIFCTLLDLIIISNRIKENSMRWQLQVEDFIISNEILYFVLIWSKECFFVLILRPPPLIQTLFLSEYFRITSDGILCPGSGGYLPHLLFYFFSLSPRRFLFFSFCCVVLYWGWPGGAFICNRPTFSRGSYSPLLSSWSQGCIRQIENCEGIKKVF